MMKSEVTGDLFCIARRLLEVNPEYRVFYEDATERFEVHSSDRPSAKTLCFVVPFDDLDVRTVEYARRTRKENADEIEAEIMAHNAEVGESAYKSLEKQMGELGDMFCFAEKAGHPVDFTNIGGSYEY